MGMNSYDLNVLCLLKEQGLLKHNPSVVEIGAQQLSNDFLGAKILLDKAGSIFGAKTPHNFPEPVSNEIVHGNLEHQSAAAPLARDFWKWIGFEHAAIDIDESPGSIPLDLNYDKVKSKHRGKFDLVTNMGTTEHIANQLNAFKVIHELTAISGIMYHLLPAQGMMNHGLINYNPKFFWMLARSNGYKWVYTNYLSSGTYYELPQNIADQVKPFNPAIVDQAKAYQVADSCIVVAMQKIFDSPFVAPLDVKTGMQTNIKVLKERYWSVFNRNPFDRYMTKKNIWLKLRSLLSV
jgi:hypothetical protein